ncbi:MAG: PQQ-dependent sugar dehydrogenase [Pseudomonadota bacterium]
MRLASLSAAVLAAAACSDGTDAPAAAPPPAGGPPPPSAAPVFSSATSASVPENTAGVLYTAEASDPEGGAITYAVSGGADAGLFSIDAATGALTSATPFDFETPADSDGDNVYQVGIEASDPDGAVATLTLELTVLDALDGVSARRVATGLAAPLGLQPAPGSDRLWVVEKGGRILDVDPATGAVVATILDITGEVSTGSEQGLLGLAVAPDFAASETFYINLTNLAGDTEIRRYAANGAGGFDGDVILKIDQPAGNHNAGWIGFDTGGLLYVPTGDGGGGGDPFANGQNPFTLLGAVLRLDVSGDDFPSDPDRDYAIPPGNPFVLGGGAPEVFAIGLRNPFQSFLDPVTGDLFIGEVGQDAVEEIDRLGPGDGGANFGWPIREGTAFFSGPDDPDFTPPVAEYLHGSGPLEGNSVTGGVVYRGPAALIADHYVFADFVNGNYWAVPVGGLVVGDTVAASGFLILTDLLQPAEGLISSPAALGLNAAGDLFIADISGDIFIVEESS